ncbi:SpoVT-AbrB domain-containing protein [Candidatus Electronema halotolerans]
MATLIRIGNSQGVRIPKTLVEQARLRDSELVFKVLAEGLLIQPVRKARQGWKEQFEQALQDREHCELDQEWLDAPLVSEEEWDW